MAAANCRHGRCSATGTSAADAAREHFALALESGINFFDTADVYSVGGSEEITGRWLKEMASRDDIVVATKVHGAMGRGPNRRGLSRKHIIEACENSLRRLQMDYVDLYQIHRWDFSTPIEETLDALDSLVRAGKVRYLGASSMAAWQFSKALYTGQGTRLASVRRDAESLQPGLSRRRARDDSAVHRPGRGHHSLEPAGARIFCRDSRKPGDGGRQPSGPETDEFAKRHVPHESDFEVADAVAEVAKQRGVSPTQIACAWVVQAPGVTAPIIGATKTHHLKELIAAVDLKLSAEELAAIEKPYRPHPVLGHEQPNARRMASAHS